MFPLQRDVNLTDVWCGPREEARATWLDWDDGGGTVETRMSSTAGLDAHSALIRDFRRFESGGLFTTLGQEIKGKAWAYLWAAQSGRGPPAMC